MRSLTTHIPTRQTNLPSQTSRRKERPPCRARHYFADPITLHSITLVVVFSLMASSSPSNAFTPPTTNGGWAPRRSSSRMNERAESTSTSVSQQIMYNQQVRQREQMHYHIIAAEATENLARRMEAAYPDRFTFHPTKWRKFADGTDDIEISGFYPRNLISGQQVLFLASFHNNDVSLSQFQVMIALLQSFIEGVCRNNHTNIRSYVLLSS